MLLCRGAQSKKDTMMHMQPIATLLADGKHPNTMREVRVIGIVNMGAIASMRKETERAGFTWLDCNREGPEVCLVIIASCDYTLIGEPCERRLQRAIYAAGIQVLD
jgi:hypothetical protein